MNGCGKMSAHRNVCQSFATDSAGRTCEGVCQCADGSVRFSEMFVNAFFLNAWTHACADVSKSVRLNVGASE